MCPSMFQIIRFCCSPKLKTFCVVSLASFFSVFRLLFYIFHYRTYLDVKTAIRFLFLRKQWQSKLNLEMKGLKLNGTTTGCRQPKYSKKQLYQELVKSAFFLQHVHTIIKILTYCISISQSGHFSKKSLIQHSTG